MIYIAYGIFEIAAGCMLLFGGIEFANRYSPGLELNASASHFLATFGAAIISIGILSFLVLRLTDMRARIAIAFTFALYNSIAIYTNWLIPPVPGKFNPPLFIHIAFAAAFLIHLIKLARERNSIITDN